MSYVFVLLLELGYEEEVFAAGENGMQAIRKLSIVSGGLLLQLQLATV